MTFKFVTVYLFASALAFYLIFKSTMKHNLADKGGCEMTYSHPSFVELDLKVEQFPQYYLYLFRERYEDREELYGTPVLFIHGNAGSYKQVRSLAKSTSYLANFKKVQSMDFFTVDFNEELSALSGELLEHQSNYANICITYILDLYKKKGFEEPKLPKSVIIVGHSMGGIVARSILTHQNFTITQINTIITLSTPHYTPRLPFEYEMVDFYYKLNNFYHKNSFHSKLTSGSKFDNLSLISISGGDMDEQIPADLTEIETFLGRDSAFTVFTTSIPKAWVSVDHQAILWCKQVIMGIAEALLDIHDPESPYRTVNIKNRMTSFRNNLLGWNELDNKQLKLKLSINDATKISDKGEFIDLNLENSKGKLFNTKNFLKGKCHFIGDNKIEIYKCTTSTSDNINLSCSSLNSIQYYSLPRKNPSILTEDINEPLYSGIFEVNNVDYLYIRPVKDLNKTKVKLEFVKLSKTMIEPSISDLIFGKKYSIQTSSISNILTKIELKLPETPLLAYKFDITTNPKLNIPLTILQYSNLIYESKYHFIDPNKSSNIILNFHTQSIFRYDPMYESHQNSISLTKGLELIIFNYEGLKYDFDFNLKLDIEASASRLYKRVDLSLALVPNLMILIQLLNLINTSSTHFNYLENLKNFLIRKLWKCTILFFIFMNFQSYYLNYLRHTFQTSKLNEWFEGYLPEVSKWFIHDHGNLATFIILSITFLSGSFLILYYIINKLILILIYFPTLFLSNFKFGKTFEGLPKFIKLLFYLILVTGLILNFCEDQLYFIMYLIIIFKTQLLFIQKNNNLNYQYHIFLLNLVLSSLICHIPKLIVHFKAPLILNDTFTFFGQAKLNLVLLIPILSFNSLNLNKIFNSSSRSLTKSLLSFLILIMILFTVISGIDHLFVLPYVTLILLDYFVLLNWLT